MSKAIEEKWLKDVVTEATRCVELGFYSRGR